MICVGNQTGVDRERVARLVAEVLAARLRGGGGSAPTAACSTCAAERPASAAERSANAAERPASPLVVNISVRHVHITQEHLEILFGAGARLTPARELYQEGQFAAEQSVDLVGPKRRMLQNVRILGPTRSATQVELAFSDAIMLGIDVPIRMSGKVDGTPGCIVLGPRGHLVLEQGVIRARRHVHMSPADAEHYGVQTGDELELRIAHPSCPVTLGGVVARVDGRARLEVHIDSDEGNACDLPGATGLELVRTQRA